jgi:hypothetical protein
MEPLLLLLLGIDIDLICRDEMLPAAKALERL